MSSGFFEIEGGTQPALPATGFGRLWYDTGDNTWKVLLSDGTNISISTISSRPEIQILAPNDEVLVFDISDNSLKKIKGSNLSPLAVQNRFLTYDEDEFAAGSTAGKLGWQVTTSGSGASAQLGTYGVNGTERAFGVVQIDTGSTATGRVTLNKQINQIQLGYCSFDQVWRLAIEELSTVTERFLATFGFIDNTGAGDHSDGVYFRYSDNLNSGNWQCVCREGSLETVVNTSVAANTNYNIFKILINSTATEANFYINDTLVATIFTNIPSTAGNFTGNGVKIEKQIGTAQRNLSVDYFTQKAEWGTGR